MWEIPTHEKLSLLILEGLTKSEIAGYFGCKLPLIEAFLDEYNLKTNVERLIKTPVFKGYTGNTIEKHFSPEKNYVTKNCLKCETRFESTGAGNRICDHCKNSTEFQGIDKQMWNY